MDQLSESMLRQSLTQVRTWERLGLPVQVSVNLPGDALGDPTLADRLVALVRPLGVDPRSLVVEVTETTVSRERALAIEPLARLRLAGFGLSLDDYGTGYASMEMLETMPITEVKVDRRFVHRASRDAKATAVLRSLLELAVAISADWAHAFDAIVAEDVAAVRLACDAALLEGRAWEQEFRVRQLRVLGHAAELVPDGAVRPRAHRHPHARDGRSRPRAGDPRG